MRAGSAPRSPDLGALYGSWSYRNLREVVPHMGENMCYIPLLAVGGADPDKGKRARTFDVEGESMRWWSELSEQQQRRLKWIGAVGLLLIVGVGGWLILGGPSSPDDPEPELAEVRAAEKAKDIGKLSATVRGGNERAAAAAVGAVARVGGGEARPVVVAALSDARPQVRQQALQWYPRIATPQDAEPVRQAVAKEKSNDVLIAGLTALGELRAWDSLDQIFQKLDHPDRDVRMAAATAAERILFLKVHKMYNIEGPSAERQQGIARLRDFAQQPGRREHYMQWLKEEQQKAVATK